MDKPSPPQAPDPTATAQAQTASNVATADNNAALNRVNQYTPYGSSVYSTDGTTSGGVPQYSQTTTLSPTEQNLFNMTQQGEQTLGQTALGQLGNLQNNYSTPFSFGGPNVQGSVASPSTSINSFANPQAIKQAQDAAYNAQTQYLDPQFKQQGDQLTAQLANLGLSQGDAAYNNAQDQFSRQKQAAYQSAQDSAVSAGNQEQNTLFGQGLSANNQEFGQNLSSANLNNSASAQALNQALGLYNQPLNSYNALATGAQVQNPTFSSVPAANQANTDVAGITNSAYANQLAQYQQSQAGINNLFSLGGSLGSAAILASDRRLKRDIVRHGQTPSGIPTYTFRYNDDPRETYFGVMADEVMHIPGAAVLMENGYYGVNYSVVK